MISTLYLINFLKMYLSLCLRILLKSSKEKGKFFNREVAAEAVQVVTVYFSDYERKE